MIQNEMPSHTHSLGNHKIQSHPGTNYNEKELEQTVEDTGK